MPRTNDVIGFVCPCGESHHFVSYVFAHWREPLVHTCPKCSRKATIIKGIVLPGGGGKPLKPIRKEK